jgi:hypothetical protein
MQLARDRKAVAAIIALAADHHDALFAHGRKAPGNMLHHARGRIFHQNDSRNACLDGGAIHFAHFARRENFPGLCHMPTFHAKPRATTTVISSGNSGAELQSVTASMIFATISFNSLF